MEGLEEVPTLQLVRQALVGGIVVQQHAQQGLLGLDVGRGVRDVDGVRDGAQIERGDEGHGGYG